MRNPKEALYWVTRGSNGSFLPRGAKVVLSNQGEHFFPVGAKSALAGIEPPKKACENRISPDGVP